jgi:hypothetical protein
VALLGWGRSYFPKDTSVHSHDGRLVVVLTDGRATWYLRQQYFEATTQEHRGVAWLWTLLRRGGKPDPYLAGTPRVRRWLGVEVYDNVKPTGRPDYWVLAVRVRVRRAADGGGAAGAAGVAARAAARQARALRPLRV